MSSITERLRSGARIIDVRSVDEFADEHYPGAENWPLHLLPAKMAELGAKNQSIIVYCASGARSAMAARLLQDAGFSQVVNAGGLEDLPRVTQ